MIGRHVAADLIWNVLNWYEIFSGMSSDRLEVSVTFDERLGYVGTAPELREPVVALSLGGLRRRIEALLLPDDVVLPRIGRCRRAEHHRRRAKTGVTAAPSAGRAREGTNRHATAGHDTAGRP